MASGEVNEFKLAEELDSRNFSSLQTFLQSNGMFEPNLDVNTVFVAPAHNQFFE
jgi:hypothetical protein